jgi:ABC-2 type transport system permease protein
MMPSWLRVFSRFNPLTYQVDALRRLMVAGGSSSFGLPRDFLVLGIAFAILIAIAARLYPKIII